MIEHGIEHLCFGFVFGESPRHGDIDVFIERTDKGPYGFDAVIDFPAVHAFAQAFQCFSSFGFDVFGCHRHHFVAGIVAFGEDTISIFLYHGQASVEQVAQVVGQVGIDTADEAVAAEIAVLAQLDVVQEVVTDGIGAKFLEQRDRIYHVTFGLGHLFTVHDEPAMAVYHFRQLDTKAHEHDGPNDGVETDDFLPHQVHIGRPEFLEFFRIVHDAGSGEVVHQCVEPYVHHVLRVEGHLDAPGEAGARYAQVFQAALHELDHFISAGFRLDEGRVFFDVFHPTVSILGHFEEIGFFTDSLQRAAAVGADVIFVELIFRPEGFAGDAVPAFVLAFVNVALVIGALEEHLHHLLVAFFGGADEVVIGNIEFLPQLLEHSHDFIGVLDRCDAGFFGLLLDLLAVLVGAGQEQYIVAVKALETSHAVCDGCAIGMSDMQLRAGVVNRSGDIIFRFFTHEKCLLPYL